MNAEAWADESVDDLYEEFAAWDPPISLEIAARFIRSAYVRGYLAALTEPAPLAETVALARRAELALRLPVL